MLEEMLRYINNRFDRDKHGEFYGVFEGTFAIENGTLLIDGMLDNQYFWIEGSAFNDGLHLYKDTDLVDEEFSGRVYKLVIPTAVQKLAAEAEAWYESNYKELNGPYQSESFGGYSYTTKQGAASGNQTPAAPWHVQFGARLRPYKKLNRDWV